MNRSMIKGIIIAAAIIGIVGVIILVSINSVNQKYSMGQHSTDTSDTSAVTPKPNEVIYKNFEVQLEKITVKKGTTVTWTNMDSAKHDVTPDKETEDFKTSELFGKGETYSVTFNTPGTYAYICSPHPYMKGTVEVTE